MAFPRPFGRYVLDERLALGGMAEIFRGRTSTEGFEKKVCIKRILPHFSEQEDFVLMFRDEAALAARLQHANIVQVFDFGTEEDTLFLAMELVDGSDLRKLIDLAKKKGVSLGVGHAMQIAIEVCRGLHHAHTLTDDEGRALGIVHRDISPHNILVSRAGEVKVTDFGIAKASARATHTGTGVVKGKLAYMAPEQAHSRPLDHRVDQFATGVVLWEMLTGSRLFVGPDEVSVLRKVMMCEVPKPSELRDGLPRALEDIVMRALAEDPEQRFHSMRHFEHALSRCLFEVTSDPEETNLRPLIEKVLGPPEVSRRNTAVLVENPVMAAPGESVPSLTEAGFSEVFSASDEGAVEASAPARPGGTIRSALGAESAPAEAPTVLRDSSSNPVARVVEGTTGVTRTVVPDAIVASDTAEATPPSFTPIPARTAELAPTVPVMPAVTIRVEEDDETARVRRDHVPVVAPAPARSRLAVAAGAAALAVVGVGIGAVLALGTDETAASDEVTVTVASPAPEVEAARGEADAPPAEPAVVAAAEPTPSSTSGPRGAGTERDEPAATAADPTRPETKPAAEEEAPAAEVTTAHAQPPDEPATKARAPKRTATSAAKEPAKAPATERVEQRQRPREQRVRPKGKAILEMASGWAHAYLGKRKLCETPCTVELPAGTHLLRFVAGNGKERKHRVTVKADTTVRAVVPTP